MNHAIRHLSSRLLSLPLIGMALALLTPNLSLAERATLPSPTTADIEVGRVYEGRVRLAASQFGVRFTLPAGHKGVLPQNSRWFLLGDEAQNGRILISADHFELGQAAQEMATGLDLGDGVQLLPLAAPRTIGKRISGRYQVRGAAPGLLAQVESVVGPHGVGVALIALAPEAALPALLVTLQRVRGSLAFSAPKQPAATPTAKGTATGSGSLAGLRLVRYFNGSGYSEKTTLELCRDGSFHRSFNASSATVLGTGAARSGSDGRYEQRGGQLILHYHDGTRTTYRVDQNGTRLLLDGAKWFRLAGACQ